MTTALISTTARTARKTQTSFVAIALAVAAAVAIVAAVIAFSLTSTTGAERAPATKASTQQPVAVGDFSQPSPVRQDGCQYLASFKRC
jgi:hypothetical protein